MRAAILVCVNVCCDGLVTHAVSLACAHACLCGAYKASSESVLEKTAVKLYELSLLSSDCMWML
jgi:hypothetical protein